MAIKGWPEQTLTGNYYKFKDHFCLITIVLLEPKFIPRVMFSSHYQILSLTTNPFNLSIPNFYHAI